MRDVVERERLLVLIDDLEIGGAQRLVELQVEAMIGTHDMTVVNLKRETPLSHRLRRLGARVEDVGMRRLLDPAGFRRLRRIAVEADVIHTHLIHSTLLGALLSRRSGVPLVVTLHNEQPDEGNLLAHIKNRLEGRVLSRRARAVIACGPRVADRQRGRTGSTRMTTVRNRVARWVPPEAEAMAAERRALGICEGDVVLLAAGRLVRQKGIDILLKAFAALLATHPAALLLIAGDGEDRPALERQAGELGAAGRVRFLGAVDDLPRKMAVADVFVMPSRWEGLPLVLLEALAAGLPVVAACVGDIASVTGEEAAVLVPPEDPAALAQALDGVLGNAARREELAELSRNAGAIYSDIEGFAEELRAVYREARLPAR